MSTKTKLSPFFKILVDNRPCHGGEGNYPPIGEWTKKIQTVECCSSGYHLTSDPLKWWKPEAKLYLAEGKGKISGDNSDKIAFQQVRLLEEITPNSPYLCAFPRIRAFLAASARSFDPKADISWANLRGADLSGAYLSKANLSGADLSGACLSKANLYRANLRGANLYRACLSRACLSRADLSEAYLYRADLLRSDLSRANLSLADLYGALRDSNPPDGWEIVNERLERK